MISAFIKSSFFATISHRSADPINQSSARCRGSVWQREWCCESERRRADARCCSTRGRPRADAPVTGFLPVFLSEGGVIRELRQQRGRDHYHSRPAVDKGLPTGMGQRGANGYWGLHFECGEEGAPCMKHFWFYQHLMLIFKARAQRIAINGKWYQSKNSNIPNAFRSNISVAQITVVQWNCKLFVLMTFYGWTNCDIGILLTDIAKFVVFEMNHKSTLSNMKFWGLTLWEKLIQICEFYCCVTEPSF